MVKKYNVKVRTILIGTGVFVLFALVLETILHQVVLKGAIGPTITGNVWYYALYGGLAAGIFEETGRFLAMKFLLKDEPQGARTAVAYVIGHGGIEMLIIFGVSMVSRTRAKSTKTPAPIRMVRTFTLYFFTIHRLRRMGTAMPRTAQTAIVIIELTGTIYYNCFNALDNWSGQLVPRPLQLMPSRREIISALFIP